MAKYLCVLYLLILNTSFAFDEEVLKEIDTINKVKDRACDDNGFKISIKGATVEVTDPSGKFGKHKYNVYDESGDFILADHLTTTNLDYTSNNFFPELIILKKGKKALLMEGLSFKFQKNGLNENCKGDKVDNLHCYSRGYNTNLSSYKKKIKLTFKEQKIRDLAGAKDFKELVFAYDNFDFHSNNVRVGNNGSIKRSVAVLNTGDVVNFTYSYPGSKKILGSCNLTL